MMAIQIHHPCWEILIVVIPCHLAESLQATISSFIFNLIIFTLGLDSNWNTMQQVRIQAKYYVLRARKRTRKIGESGNLLLNFSQKPKLKLTTTKKCDR